MFPSFSSIQSDHAQLRKGYLKLLRATALCIVPVSVGLAALAPEVVTVLLGRGWSIAGPVLSVLALLGALQILAANAGTLLRTMGNSRQATVSEVIFVIVSAALLLPLSSKLHLVGVAWAMTIGAAAGWAWAERAVLRVLNISFRELLQAFESSVAAALVMLAALYLLRGLFPQVNWLSLTTMVAGAGLMYLATVAVAALSRKRTLKADATAN
jgi:O-antigen/teichoic acid export membrane protein